MRICLKYNFGSGPFLEDSYGNQRVLSLFTNDFDFYVCFYDIKENSTYIERVVNKLDNAFKSSNLTTIKNEEEYFSVLTFLCDNDIIKKL